MRTSRNGRRLAGCVAMAAAIAYSGSAAASGDGSVHASADPPSGTAPAPPASAAPAPAPPAPAPAPPASSAPPAPPAPPAATPAPTAPATSAAPAAPAAPAPAAAPTTPAAPASTATPASTAPANPAANGQAGAEAEVPVEPPQAGSTEAKHERAMVGLDLVLGWGKVPFALQNLPGAGNQAVTYTRADAVPSDVQSFIMGASVEVAEHVGVGVRLPFTFAGFSPDGSEGRSTTAFGNTELEGEYGARIAKGLRLYGSFGVALPTAQGTEIPSNLVNQNAQYVDATAYDRYSLERAAMAARGYEDNALFAPDRLGLVPKVGLLYRAHGFSVEPYVKLENLVGTSSSLMNEYVGDFVGAVRVGYWVREQFEVALKGWADVGFGSSCAGFYGVGSSGSSCAPQVPFASPSTTTVALEPQLVLRFGPVRPYASVIVPVAGPPADEGFVGVRVGAAVGF